MWKIKRTVSVIMVLMVCIASTVIPCVTVNAVDYPDVVSYSSHITSYIGLNVNVKFKLYHKYYDEKLYVDVYNSKNKIVASAEDFFDKSDPDEQIYTFTWLAKNAPAGKYTVVATAAYYNGYEWRLSPEDTFVAVTLKNIPAPKLKSAVNVKGKKITAKWSAVKKATNYQVQIGSKTYKTKKTAFTASKLQKGKTYSVKVRTYMNKKWSKWSNTKKVKIKK